MMHADSARDFRIARALVDGPESVVSGPTTSRFGLVQGLAFHRFLVPFLLADAAPSSAQRATVALTAVAIALLFLSTVRRFGLGAGVLATIGLLAWCVRSHEIRDGVLWNPSVTLLPATLTWLAAIRFLERPFPRNALLAGIAISVTAQCHVAAVGLLPALLFHVAAHGRSAGRNTLLFLAGFVGGTILSPQWLVFLLSGESSAPGAPFAVMLLVVALLPAAFVRHRIGRVDPERARSLSVFLALGYVAVVLVASVVGAHLSLEDRYLAPFVPGGAWAVAWACRRLSGLAAHRRTRGAVLVLLYVLLAGPSTLVIGEVVRSPRGRTGLSLDDVWRLARVLESAGLTSDEIKKELVGGALADSSALHDLVVAFVADRSPQGGAQNSVLVPGFADDAGLPGSLPQGWLAFERPSGGQLVIARLELGIPVTSWTLYAEGGEGRLRLRAAPAGVHEADPALLWSYRRGTLADESRDALSSLLESDVAALFAESEVSASDRGGPGTLVLLPTGREENCRWAPVPSAVAGHVLLRWPRTLDCGTSPADRVPVVVRFPGDLRRWIPLFEGVPVSPAAASSSGRPLDLRG